MAAVLMGRAFCGFPGVLLSRWPLRACCYRRGSADAARSRATDPAATRAEPAAILGLRRCTARAARRTLNTAFGASMAIPGSALPCQGSYLAVSHASSDIKVDPQEEAAESYNARSATPLGQWPPARRPPARLTSHLHALAVKP
jgi:hypothetical protein